MNFPLFLALPARAFGAPRRGPSSYLSFFCVWVQNIVHTCLAYSVPPPPFRRFPYFLFLVACNISTQEKSGKNPLQNFLFGSHDFVLGSLLSPGVIILFGSGQSHLLSRPPKKWKRETPKPSRPHIPSSPPPESIQRLRFYRFDKQFVKGGRGVGSSSSSVHRSLRHPCRTKQRKYKKGRDQMDLKGDYGRGKEGGGEGLRSPYNGLNGPWKGGYLSDLRQMRREGLC